MASTCTFGFAKRREESLAFLVRSARDFELLRKTEGFDGATNTFGRRLGISVLEVLYSHTLGTLKIKPLEVLCLKHGN